MGKRSIRYSCLHYLGNKTGKAFSECCYSTQNRRWYRSMGLMNLPSWEHYPQGAAARSSAVEIFFPPNTASSPKCYCLPYQNYSRNKFVPPVFPGKSFFPSSPKETPVGVSIVASISPPVTQVPLLPLPLRTVTQSSGGKGRRGSSWGGKEKESVLQTAFYWERFQCCRLHWEADSVQLHWELNRIFLAGWQPHHICNISSGKCPSSSKLP